MSSPDHIMEIAMAFQRSRILLTAFDLGIFTALGNSKKSSIASARSIKADARATDRLMNALCAMGLLKKDGNLFVNSIEASTYLIKGRPLFMSNLGHSSQMWESWSTLTSAVKAGTSVRERERPRGMGNWTEKFIEAMHYRAKRSAEELLFHIDLSCVKKTLDIGGGSGAFSMAFVQKNKDIEATVFDVPDVIPLTKRYVAKEGLSKSFKYLTGDYNKAGFGKGFDLVLISSILHINSPKQNISLIKRVSKALNPGGQLVIREFLIDESRTKPPFAAFFALNMLVATESGDTYTEEEIRGWMKRAGLTSIRRLSRSSDIGILVGRKL